MYKFDNGNANVYSFTIINSQSIYY